MIRRAGIVFLLLLCLASARNGRSEDGWKFDYAVGPQVDYVAYVEPGVMEEAGFMWGGFGSLDIAGGRARCRAFVSYVAGDLDYKSDPDVYAWYNRSIKLTTAGSVFNLRGTGGYALAGDRQVTTLFAGLGYRYLVDDLPDEGLFSGYRREQTYFYLPLGAEIAWALDGGSRIEAVLEFDVFLQGRNRSAGVDLTQDSGYGFRASARYVSAPASFWNLPALALSVEPFVQYWNVSESDWAAGGMYEPDNNSTTFGLRLGADF